VLLNLRRFFQESWLLIAASFSCGLLLAATNAALSPRIEMNKVMKLTNLAGTLLPEATTFAPLEEPLEVRSLDGRTEPATVYKAVADDRVVGWIFRVVGSGFADKIELVVAADAPFQKLAGVDVLASNETPGFGDQIKQMFFRGQFFGAPVAPFTLVRTGNREQIDSTIVAISGATVSSTAVVEAMNHYLPQIREQLQQKGLIGNGNQP
jgi:RnfABCDGE-type electron transport complex G subunit